MATSGHWPRVMGGPVVLDFVNTGIAAGGDPGADVLRTGDGFVAWLEHVGVAARPGSADDALLRDLGGLRATLRAVLEAVAHGDPADPAALADLRTAYADAVTRSALELDADGLRWARHDLSARAGLDQLARDAVDLLRAEPAARIKACPGCGFVFLDATKNAGRRWCSMDDCGTREKMRRYVAKRSAAKGAAAKGASA